MNEELLDLLVVEYLTQRVIFFIERFGYHNLDIVESSDGAINYLDENLYDYIFIGGELGEKDDSGVNVAKYLVDHQGNPNMFANIIIHSWCVAAASKMIKLLPHAHYLPFNEKQLSTLQI